MIRCSASRVVAVAIGVLLLASTCDAYAADGVSLGPGLIIADSVYRIADPVPEPHKPPPLGLQPYPDVLYDLDFWQAHPDYLERALVGRFRRG